MKGVNRFGILHLSIDGISKQMLAKQLRELEDDSILIRRIYAEILPRVESFISDYGKTLFPAIESMKAWGEKNIPSPVSA